MSEILAPAIGIDLGTTYCCVATVDEYGAVNVIYNSTGKQITPSYVSFTNTDVIVGNIAQDLASTNLKNSIFDVKRLIGRRFNDPIVQSDMKHWPFKVIEDENKLKIEVEHKGIIKQLYPEQISAKLLSYLKEAAEDFYTAPVRDAVITVPAYFNNSQRQATKFAAEIAGLNVLRILNEPTAAAIAYGMRRRKKQNILVYDLGGGTFDVSIIEINNGNFTVKAVGGNNHLGGDDFTRTMVDYFIDRSRELYKVDLRDNPVSISKLYKYCEEAKSQLSFVTETKFAIDCISGIINCTGTLNKSKFKQLNAHYFEATLDVIKQCLKDADMDKSDINEILLVGGSSRIPAVREIVSNFFGNVPISKITNPDHAVATGAALLAAQIQGTSPGMREISLNDVIPLSLGITTLHQGFMHVIIKRNTKIPVSETHQFTTLYDNQETLTLDVYEGEEELVKNNYLLGKFDLDGITPAPANTVISEVTFDVDSNGILTVSAEEINKSKKNEKKITITHSGLWSDSDIQSMIEESKDLTS